MPNTLYAISDIHLSHPANLKYWTALAEDGAAQSHGISRNSGLILAGDVGESIAHLRAALETACKVFSYVWWVPGNHELYTSPRQNNPSDEPPSYPTERARMDAEMDTLRGEERYHAFVDVCQQYPNVYTPEDEWVVWDSDADDPVTSLDTEAKKPSTQKPVPTTNTSNPPQRHPTSKALICPIFTLYDYSFRPAHIKDTESALAWAQEADIIATDEALLHNDPYPSRESWCEALVTKFRKRLSDVRAQAPSLPFVLINHWPLHEAVLHIPSIPRFSLWCGTRKTRYWQQEYAPVAVVVSGHLHVRRTDWIGDTRWEEVSLGYPRQWTKIREQELTAADVLREILPGVAPCEAANNAAIARAAGIDTTTSTRLGDTQTRYDDPSEMKETQISFYRAVGGR